MIPGSGHAAFREKDLFEVLSGFITKVGDKYVVKGSI
jgi:hypothetical protein